MNQINNEYKVFARSYRPRQFKDLIGQDFLVQTLENAIKTGKLAHAYLLTGIRGVGKTTTARIIAMSINCLNKNQDNITEPCLECSSCKSIINDNHPDVLEMDAASKTGVDDIRELINNASYTPSLSKYKIYIIDEVHMLSNNAFNALLKTLEEPPKHTKFIFATTETRKIPLTILSRCQRFDLKRVTNEQLTILLENICDKEAIKHEIGALNTLCNLSGGSVRDALSLLDQMRLVTNNNLTTEVIRNTLGYSDLENCFALYNEIIKGNVPELLARVNQMFNAGAEVKNILNDLLEITYLISKANILKDNFTEIKVSSTIETEIKNLASQLQISTLAPIWQMLLKAVDEINLSPNQFQALEMSLIRICHLSSENNLNKIISEVKKKL
ncbi:MAG: DNA polymerase III subunit gamma/tau [Alphaproteobacteria bacterium]|jgi:DNA polymerase III subunit gamma/tau|nr:DNA polymerase III subunit gamma/tau [Alphaproteobacteria bacterium]MBT5827332.1 DNA polymerase III subunit gamma/tau [Alphaproteobacteria bacterium]